MRSVVIHQPEFIPWLNLFCKAALSDVFVLLDNVQYLRRGFHNRNLIKSAAGARWLTLPIRKAPRETQIKDVLLDNGQEWRQSQLSALNAAYSRAEYFQSVYGMVEEILGHPWEKLSDLNAALLENLAERMGLASSFIRASSLPCQGRSSELILSICKAVGAERYVCGLGSRAYLNEEAFARAGIRVLFIPPVPWVYAQCSAEQGFVEDLSVVDYLFNQGFEAFAKAAPKAMAGLELKPTDFRWQA